MKLEDTIVISFSGDEHKSLQNEFHKLYGDYFADSIAYDTDWIKTTKFYEENAELFSYNKYFGYFLWKPYIIQYTIKHNYGYKVLYCDTNLRFTNFDEFARVYRRQMAEQGAFFVKHVNFINKDWTKRDCFILMEADSLYYWESNQVWTPLMGFDWNAPTVKELLVDYINYCKDSRLVTEEENTLGENLPGFREHRWEQSVMSILWRRYGFTGIPDSLVLNWVKKMYPEEIMKLKERINANPLAKSL
jgi:hypothetical protein